MKEMGVAEATAKKFGPAFFFILLTIGRLAAGGALMIMSPRTCFRLSALLGVIGGVLLMLGIPNLAIPGVLLAGLGFANIWPMLFSITVEEDPERSNELSGLMCMAISGGAIVPLVMGKLVEHGNSDFPTEPLGANSAVRVGRRGQDALAVDRHHVGQRARMLHTPLS